MTIEITDSGTNEIITRDGMTIQVETWLAGGQQMRRVTRMRVPGHVCTECSNKRVVSAGGKMMCTCPTCSEFITEEADSGKLDP